MLIWQCYNWLTKIIEKNEGFVPSFFYFFNKNYDNICKTAILLMKKYKLYNFITQMLTFFMPKLWNSKCGCQIKTYPYSFDLKPIINI